MNTTFTPFPILTTDRLTLRQVIADDDQEIFKLRSDIEVNKYLDRQLSNTIDDARNFINKINDNIQKGNSVYWGITFSEKSILIGTICLFGFSQDNSTCEIGYELLPGFQGKGLMREAMQKVIDYAFNTLHAKQIEAFVHKDNQTSIRLLEKLYFRNSKEPDEENPDLLSYTLGLN